MCGTVPQLTIQINNMVLNQSHDNYVFYLNNSMKFLYIFIQLQTIHYKMKNENTYRVSQEECARLWESVPYVKVYRYNPKHLYPKLNGYGDNDQRKVRSSCGSTYCTCSADALRVHQNAQSAKLNQYFNTTGYSCAM